MYTYISLALSLYIYIYIYVYTAPFRAQTDWGLRSEVWCIPQRFRCELIQVYSWLSGFATCATSALAVVPVCRDL